MPIATDPLSLVFIGCFAFGLLYLLITLFLGSLGHGDGVGHDVHGHFHFGHAGHVGDAGHVGHAGHTGHMAHPTHATGHGHHAPSSSKEVQVGHKGGFQFSILSVLNPLGLVLFLLGFGAFGYVFKNINPLGNNLLISLIGALGGLVLSVLMLYTIRKIFGTGEAHTEQDVADRTGLVGKVSITIREKSLGEILYLSPGGMHKSIPARSVDGHRIERGQEVVVLNYHNGVAEVDTWEHFIQQEQEEAPQQLPEAADLEQLRTLLDDLKRMDYVTDNNVKKE
jgi:hypothetical protein